MSAVKRALRRHPILLYVLTSAILAVLVGALIEAVDSGDFWTWTGLAFALYMALGVVNHRKYLRWRR